jgi:hypothetical protein
MLSRAKKNKSSIDYLKGQLVEAIENRCHLRCSWERDPRKR